MSKFNNDDEIINYLSNLKFENVEIKNECVNFLKRTRKLRCCMNCDLYVEKSISDLLEDDIYPERCTSCKEYSNWRQK